MIADFVLLRML